MDVLVVERVYTLRMTSKAVSSAGQRSTLMLKYVQLVVRKLFENLGTSIWWGMRTVSDADVDVVRIQGKAL
jgi:hypothetical protein